MASAANCGQQRTYDATAELPTSPTNMVARQPGTKWSLMREKWLSSQLSSPISQSPNLPISQLVLVLVIVLFFVHPHLLHNVNRNCCARDISTGTRAPEQPSLR